MELLVYDGSKISNHWWKERLFNKMSWKKNSVTTYIKKYDIVSLPHTIFWKSTQVDKEVKCQKSLRGKYRWILG